MGEGRTPAPIASIDPEIAAATYARIMDGLGVPADFNFKCPDYAPIIANRATALERIRAEPAVVDHFKAYYRDHPDQFIEDWGVTADPRNAGTNVPVLMPFVLMPKQREWIIWLVEHWKASKPGLSEKTRDMGLSWVAISLSCTLCLFYTGMAIGFGSRKEEYVDKLGAPKALFPKARIFMSNLPVEFRGRWDLERDAPHMRINFPDTGSNISGEAGDNIGRGDRTSIYFVDEAAYLERPQLIEQSLSATTNCRQDISSANGSANPFAEKRHGGNIDVFTFHWRDDPRKDDAWYAKKKRELDPVTVAQEIDINYAASVEGVLIPHEWVLAARDAHLKIKLTPSGARTGSLDVADEGRDKNAFIGAHGIIVEFIDQWSGAGGDIFATTERCFNICDTHRYTKFRYDADGLGAGVRGDARVINDKRRVIGTPQIEVEAFRGSEAVFNPEGEDVKGRKNKDYFANRKAQAWWSLRTRFMNTYRLVVEGAKDIDLDSIISLSTNCILTPRLITELSQPTYSINTVGKIVVDKAPEGSASPNLADGVMIQFSPVTRAPMRINPALLARI